MVRYRNIKWTQAFLLALLKIAVGNTNIIAINSGYNTTLKDTTIEIIKHLAKNTTFKKEKGSIGVKKCFEHFPMKIEKPKLCVQCSKNGNKSNIKYSCKVCEVSLHPECFESYHIDE